MAASKFSVIQLIPLLILIGFGWLAWSLQEPTVPQQTGDAASADPWLKEELKPTEAGKLPSGWEAPRGSFLSEAWEGSPAVTLLAEPMVEGRIIIQQLLRGGGGVRAQMQGDRAPRAFPRFGVGMQGKSAEAGEAKEVTFQLRATPAQQKLEIVRQVAETDTSLAETAWTWQDKKPLWLELLAIPSDKGAVLEGRAWADGETRPDKPLVTHESTLNPSLIKATLHATPFALKPVRILEAARLPTYQETGSN